MSKYKLKSDKIAEKVIGAYQRIENKFVDTFLNEDGSMKTGGASEKVSSAYQKIEDAVVGGYKKVEGAFVDAFLEQGNESVHETEIVSNSREDEKMIKGIKKC